MAEVFAGFVAGYVLALLTTLPIALLLFRLRASSEVVARLVPPQSAIAFGFVLHGGLFFCWTLLGIILGLVLLAMDGAGRFAGSANFAFTLFVAAITLMLVAPFAFVIVGARRYIVLGALSVVLVFGWLMPWLAEWSTFNK